MKNINPPSPPVGCGIFLGSSTYLIVQGNGTGILTTRMPGGKERREEISQSQLETFAYRLDSLIGNTR